MATLNDTRLDGEGYVVEPEQWDEALARAQDVSLTDDHWFVIRFMRDYHQEHQVRADAPTR